MGCALWAERGRLRRAERLWRLQRRRRLWLVCGDRRVPDSERAACGEPDWRDEPSSCEPCDFDSCGACADSGFCSWCPGVGCINDAIDDEVAMRGGEAIATAAAC